MKEQTYTYAQNVPTDLVDTLFEDIKDRLTTELLLNVITQIEQGDCAVRLSDTSITEIDDYEHRTEIRRKVTVYPIVYCKDCKYFCRRVCEPLNMVEMWCGLGIMNGARPYDFCSRGEEE